MVSQLHGQRIIISGSHGLIGAAVTAALRAHGARVVPLVRRAGDDGGLLWNPAAGEIDAAGLEGASAVIHLAGEPVGDGRWSAAKKERIRRSRVEGTALLAKTVAALRQPPRCLLAASAVGYYGPRRPAPVAEVAPPGSGFLAAVCRDWEAALAPAEQCGVRVVRMRFGVVLSKGGGVLAKVVPLFKLGLGGPLGDGRQIMSWISSDDCSAALLFLLTHEQISGAVNVTSPRAASNAEFTQALAHVLKRRARLPVPARVLRLMLGELADELLLASIDARPNVLIREGFSFRLPQLADALVHALA